MIESWMTDYLRYHVLVRVFGGDVEAWIALATRIDNQPPDLDFLIWLKKRLEADPSLLPRIRNVVENSGLWPISVLETDREPAKDRGPAPSASPTECN